MPNILFWWICRKKGQTKFWWYKKSYLSVKLQHCSNPLLNQSVQLFTLSLICICLLFFTSVSILLIFISPTFVSPTVSLSLLWHCLLPTSSQSSILIPSQLCCTHLFVSFSLWWLSLYLYTSHFWLPLIPSLFMSETALSGGTQSAILEPFTKYKYPSVTLLPFDSLGPNHEKLRLKLELFSTQSRVSDT